MRTKVRARVQKSFKHSKLINSSKLPLNRLIEVRYIIRREHPAIRYTGNPLASTFRFKKGQCNAPSGRHDQKSSKFVRGRLFSFGITKVAVLKFAPGKPELDLVGLAVFFSD